MNTTLKYSLGLGALTLTGIGVYFVFRQLQDNKTNSSYPLPSKKGAASAVIEPNWADPFDMDYSKQVAQWTTKPIQILSEEKAEQYAKTIKNAKGVFNDRENDIETIFKKELKDKTQVSSISAAFYTAYQTDLWQFLKSFLNHEELKALVHTPTKQLPNYRWASSIHN